MDRKVVWHRNDLRLRDNKALSEAGQKAVPIYIFDPNWLENELVSDTRIEFVIECLQDLNRQYQAKNSRIALFKGNPVKVLSGLQDEGYEIYFNEDANHFRRQMEEKARQRFTGFTGDGIVRNKEGARKNWRANAENYIKSKPFRTPEDIEDNPLEAGIKLDEIREKYDIEPEKKKFGPGGSKEAGKRLQDFLDNIEKYPSSISSPIKAEKNTSHLSPYIRYGCVSRRQVFRHAKWRAKNSEKPDKFEMFIDRIYWHLNISQKVEDNPKLHKESVNPVFRDLNKEDRSEEKINAWKKGETGYPLVDASMRALVETGWINFRMRAMCATFFSYILGQWWKEGADFFYKHLIDSDIAINYYQWQMHSGIVGVHKHRIYNPTKQIKDNDPEGKFIKKYVPELRALSPEQIVKPWEMSDKEQRKTGVDIGKNYPEPIVNRKNKAQKARKFFKAKKGEAYAAFKDDEVWKRASLSPKHDREQIIENASNQKSLTEY
ncbi:MAG: deoxyribodipyrimidine photolyase [Nanohaloarchaea archaeon SW_7_43_1]|nr:MAG: deoxyribodipyrimidine photolyase [Nanohaloarchaea archaeon SW_7_43_1]